MDVFVRLSVVSIGMGLSMMDPKLVAACFREQPHAMVNLAAKEVCIHVMFDMSICPSSGACGSMIFGNPPCGIGPSCWFSVGNDGMKQSPMVFFSRQP